MKPFVPVLLLIAALGTAIGQPKGERKTIGHHKASDRFEGSDAFSTLGRAVSVPPFTTADRTGVSRLDISAWKPGLYWLRIQTSEGTAVQKVVKR